MPLFSPLVLVTSPSTPEMSCSGTIPALLNVSHSGKAVGVVSDHSARAVVLSRP